MALATLLNFLKFSKFEYMKSKLPLDLNFLNLYHSIIILTHPFRNNVLQGLQIKWLSTNQNSFKFDYLENKTSE